MKKINVVVIGGGTGTFTVLTGLKLYPSLALTAVINMTDSGGSTGRLRDEFGILPVGDVRLSLVALAREDEASRLLRELFLYRFASESSSLAGHNFGNLFLTALTDMLGSEEAAIEAAAEILNVSGKILPVTTNNVHLVAEYANGEKLYGEKNIDDPDKGSHDSTARLVNLWTEPSATLNPKVRVALMEADFIIIGPGDLYSSLLSNMVIGGMPEVLKVTKAKIIYVANLVSKFGQTHGMTQQDYLSELEKYTQRQPNFIILNSTKLPLEVLNHYLAENSFPVTDDLELSNVVRADLLSSEVTKTVKGDVLQRSLIRHDSHKLAEALWRIINSTS